MKDCRDIESLKAPYVEGETSAEDHSTVETHLARCGRCRGEVEAERAARDLLMVRREELRETAPEALRVRCAAQAARPAAVPSPALTSPARLPLYRRWVPMSLAATLLLAVAGVFGLGLTQKSQALAFQMTLDHLACSRTVHASESGARAASDRWQERFGWAVRLAPSSDAPALRLKGLRRCFVTDGGVAHALYDWNGETVSVYVLPSAALRDEADVRRFGHEAVMWSRNGRTYVVLTHAPRRPEFDRVVGYVKANMY
jgi:anti-sigma factor RsiW